MGGSLFLDYRHSADFTGAVNVIYGHNMNDGSMFGELEAVRQPGLLHGAPAMTLETADKTYTLHAVYGFVISAEEWVQRDFVNTANRDALLEYASQRSTFKSDYAPASKRAAGRAGDVHECGRPEPLHPCVRAGNGVTQSGASGVDEEKTDDRPRPMPGGRFCAYGGRGVYTGRERTFPVCGFFA